MNNNIAFIPGFGFKPSIFEIIAKEFSGHNIIYVDLTKDINNQLPDNCILIAWSLGGIIATNLCLQHPNKFKKLITIAHNPKFIATHDWPGVNTNDFSAFQQLAKSNPEELLKHFAKLVNGKNKNSLLREFMQSHITDDKKSMLDHLDLLSQSDHRDSLNKLNTPLLQIYGDQDYLIPENCATILKTKHSHNIKTISGAGHIPFITHTEECTQLIKDFIS